MSDVPFLVREGLEPKKKDSSTLTPDFEGVNIGASKLPIKETGGAIDVSDQPLKVAAAVANDEPSTKLQLDTAASALQAAIDAANLVITSLDGRLTTAEGNIVSLDGRLTTAEGLIATHGTAISTLQSDLGLAEANIANLQIDVAAIYANTPKEQDFTATAAQTIFTATVPGLIWNASNAVLDIEVWVDGRRQLQAQDGVFDSPLKNFRKNSTSQIEFAVGVTEGSVITIWKQGTSSGSGGGGGQGLSSGNPASAFYMLDQGDMITVWKLDVTGGVLSITEV